MSALPNWEEMAKEARVEAVKILAAEGLSAGQIANRFRNASRSAIMGYVARNNINLSNQRLSQRLRERSGKAEVRPHPGNIARKAASRKFDPGLKAEPKPTSTPVAPAEEIVPVSRARAFDPLPGRAPIHLTELTKTQCRWPVNGIDGSEPIFCGAHAGAVYCNSHARMAYTPR